MTSRLLGTGSLSRKGALALAALRIDQRPHTAYEPVDELSEQVEAAPPTEYRGLNRRIMLGQEWGASIGLDPLKFGTHSLRRTNPVPI